MDLWICEVVDLLSSGVVVICNCIVVELCSCGFVDLYNLCSCTIM